MQQLILLNTAEALETALSNQLLADKIILTTHPTVYLYLQEKTEYEVHFFSELFLVKELSEMRNFCSDEINTIVEQLDKRYRSQITAAVGGIEQNYFQPIYGYHFKNHVAFYYVFIQSLEKWIRENEIETIFYDDCDISGVFQAGLTVEDLLQALSVNVDLQKLSVTTQNSRLFARPFQNFHKAFYSLRSPQRLIQKFQLEAKQKVSFKEDRDTILVFEELYDFADRREELNNHFNLIYYSKTDALLPEGFTKDDLSVSFSISTESFPAIQTQFNDQTCEVILQHIVSDFNQRIAPQLFGLRKLNEILDQHEVKLGFWCNSPNFRFKALVFENLRRRNIPLVGAQHGGTYGEIDYKEHFDSDFSFCDYFLSYGLDQDQYEKWREFTNQPQTNLQLIPVGRKQQRFQPRKTVDYFYPITNSQLPFLDGLMRTPANELLQYQLDILRYLNQLTNRETIVKPFMWSQPDRCAAELLRDQLSNLTFMNHLNIKEFLQVYHPKAVIIDLASTPLNDLLHLDTEIFLLEDTLNPYLPHVVEMLEKRVHFARNAQDLLVKVQEYESGQLPTKRDDTFMHHFCKIREEQFSIIDALTKIIHESKQTTVLTS